MNWIHRLIESLTRPPAVPAAEQNINCRDVIIEEHTCGYKVVCPHCAADNHRLLMDVTMALSGFGRGDLKEIEPCQSCNGQIRMYNQNS